MTQSDLSARTIQRTLDGPACPKSIHASLMAHAKGLLPVDNTNELDEYWTDRFRNQRLADVRRKSRRSRELLKAFR